MNHPVYLIKHYNFKSGGKVHFISRQLLKRLKSLLVEILHCIEGFQVINVTNEPFFLSKNVIKINYFFQNEASRPIVVAPIPENIISLVAEQTPAVETRPIVVAESPVPSPVVIAAPSVAVNPPVLIKSEPAPAPQLVPAKPVLVSDYPKGPVVPVQESPVVNVPPAVVSDPVVHAQAPAAVVSVPVIAATITAQHHSQDELGQYSYGYVNPLSAKEEISTADGITKGGYSYLDSHGLVQNVNYVSDDVSTKFL